MTALCPAAIGQERPTDELAVRVAPLVNTYRCMLRMKTRATPADHYEIARGIDVKIAAEFSFEARGLLAATETPLKIRQV